MYPLFFLQQNILQCSVQNIFGKCSSRIHLAHSTFPLELYVADILKPNILTLSSNHGFFFWLCEEYQPTKEKKIIA